MSSSVVSADGHKSPGSSTPLVASLLEKQSPVAIYGAGNVGKEVFAVLRNHGVPVRCFIDQKAQAGDDRQGVPVLRLDDERIGQAERRSLPVIIAIFNTDVDIPPIIENLNARGYVNVISFLDLHHHFAHELGDRYWLTSRSFYDSHEKAIAEVFSLWEDEASRRLYSSILEFRRTGNFAVLPEPDKRTQYFPPDLPKWKAPVRLIDCGAFDGDTISALLAGGGGVEAVVAFEPDPRNFSRLADVARRNSRLVADGIYLWPCGVHSHSGQLRFAANKDAASHVAADGSEVIQCVSLDDAVHGFGPTLIKMDIEGAEYAALQGARQIILENRPGLAVCVYHCPEDIWQIPLLVRDWQCGYKFHLRLHGFSGFDLVMYAVQDLGTSIH